MMAEMQSPPVRLTLRNITKRFGPTTALEGLDLELTGGLGTQTLGAGHLEVEQLGRGDRQRDADHDIADPVSISE